MSHLKDKFNKIFLLCLTGLSMQATFADSQPKFTIVPTTVTSIEVLSTDTYTVQYRVTNQTKITRTLTMVPINSISQKNSDVGSCANPFTLSSKQSCLLTLSINGRQLPVKGIHAGPVVCKTKGSNDNSPDPLLCSQPSASAALNIVTKAAPPVMVTAGFYTATNTKTYPLVAKSSDGGGSWSYTIDSTTTQPPGLSNQGAFLTANCSGQICVVGGKYVVNSITYPIVAKSNNGGASWSYTIDSATTLPSGYSDNGALNSVNCSGQICVAAGTYKNTNNKEYPLLARSGNGGASWSYVIDSATTLPPDFDIFASFASTNCSSQNCLAAGVYFPVDGGTFPLLARSGNGGISWNYVIDNRPATLPKDFGSIGEFKSTNCSGQICVTVGNYNSNGAQIPLLARSTNGGASWSYVIDGASAPPSGFNNDGSFNSTYCSGQICVAAGQYTGANNIIYPLLARSGNGGASWSYVIDKSVLPSGFGSGAIFSSASCSGQTCVASGFYLDKNDVIYPLLARSGNGGVSWSYAIDKTTTPPPGFSGSGNFTSSNCDGQICVAAGFYDGGGFGAPLLMRSADGGISWAYVIDSRPSTLPADFHSGGFNAVSVSAVSSLLPNDLSFLNPSFIHQPHQGVLKRHY
ncbi:MAG: sialidase family protein [Legionella sp.]|nr:sialidase family protein [Legionella sp.]